MTICGNAARKTLRARRDGHARGGRRPRSPLRATAGASTPHACGPVAARQPHDHNAQDQRRTPDGQSGSLRRPHRSNRPSPGRRKLPHRPPDHLARQPATHASRMAPAAPEFRLQPPDGGSRRPIRARRPPSGPAAVGRLAPPLRHRPRHPYGAQRTAERHPQRYGRPHRPHGTARLRHNQSTKPRTANHNARNRTPRAELTLPASRPAPPAALRAEAPLRPRHAHRAPGARKRPCGAVRATVRP